MYTSFLFSAYPTISHCKSRTLKHPDISPLLTVSTQFHWRMVCFNHVFFVESSFGRAGMGKEKKNMSSDINLAWLIHPPLPARSILVCEPTIALFVVPEVAAETWRMSNIEGPKLQEKKKQIAETFRILLEILRYYRTSFPNSPSFVPCFTLLKAIAFASSSFLCSSRARTCCFRWSSRSWCSYTGEVIYMPWWSILKCQVSCFQV